MICLWWSCIVWLGKLTTLKTLRSRPKGLRLSKLLEMFPLRLFSNDLRFSRLLEMFPLIRVSKVLVTLPLRLFSFMTLILEPLAVLLLPLVTIIQRRKTNILATCCFLFTWDKTSVKLNQNNNKYWDGNAVYCLQDYKIFKTREHPIFIGWLGFFCTKNKEECATCFRPQGELLGGTGGSDASFVFTCARSA